MNHANSISTKTATATPVPSANILLALDVGDDDGEGDVVGIEFLNWNEHKNLTVYPTFHVRIHVVARSCNCP